ncbi:uncharacterized protein LOC123512591 [Portunus trituberculatus]|uniref:uncharacterized protein LOC123512591 n=1 Tax=Portunus trituberculatus TaxID=210409 RepID=UPI001E1CBB2C|nr:uncharacterized protein LOC123512591 [Portunus trituberculatus]XP_045124952.1 uncharacterized protein LOC123512591 [Portunus trituberculatus]
MDPPLPRAFLCFLAALLLVLAGLAGAQSANDDYLECYYYTWTGKNESVDCELCKVDIMNEAQPCLDTLVYTVPHQQPPNVTDLKNHCDTVQSCPPYTCKEKKKCVKLMWYDITGSLVNYSSFCGNVIVDGDTPNRYEMTNGLLEMTVSTFTKKVYVCDWRLCNDASSLSVPGGVVLVLVSLVPLLTSLIFNPTSSLSPPPPSFIS